MAAVTAATAATAVTKERGQMESCRARTEIATALCDRHGVARAEKGLLRLESPLGSMLARSVRPDEDWLPAIGYGPQSPGPSD